MAAEDFNSSRFRMDGARSTLGRNQSAHYFQMQLEALEDAVDSKPSIALDLARSLIETTCKTILEDVGQQIVGAPQCSKLVKQTIACLRLTPNHSVRETKDGVGKVVNGIATMVHGLSEIRNHEGSASHGRDAFGRSLEPIHAQLAARSADAVVAFLWSVHQAGPAEIVNDRLRYEDHTRFNDWLDQGDPIEVLGILYKQSEVLFKTDPKAYKEGLVDFENGSLGQAEEDKAQSEARLS
jgi:hypothetical protein